MGMRLRVESKKTNALGECITARAFLTIKLNVMKEKIESLQNEVYNKFGNVRAFCNQTGANYHTTTNLFNGRISHRNIANVFNEVKRLVESCKPAKCQVCINNKERENVRIALVKRWKTVTNFCQAHPWFSQTFVHNVIAGKRKSKDGRFGNLCQALNIKQQQQP